MMLRLTLVLLMLVQPAAAETRVFSAGPQQTPLVELYTSEGCSSCPPAERWMNALSGNERLWLDFVPVAFHVDYWDYIGWDDRYAQPAFSQRQRRYVREGAARSVYTPGMFSAGAEWLAWRRLDAPTRGAPGAGLLRATVDGQRLSVSFIHDDRDEPLTVHVALLGSGFETQVRAGENRGRTLRHNFVVLEHVEKALRQSGSAYDAELELPESAHRPERRALAVWVSPHNRLEPLQATGGYLD